MSTHTPASDDLKVADLIARFIKSQGVQRVYGLCGGHIMPVWMALDAHGIRIIDVRDERAAVYMAHAESELTGTLGVALVTAGPGVTNAMTGIANAHVARASVLVLSGTPPLAQEHRGALQDMVHTELVASITRLARTVRHPALVLSTLNEAAARAMGHGGEPGPVYLDFPVDVLRACPPAAVLLPEFFKPVQARATVPLPADVLAAAELLWQAKRPLFISGRGAKGASAPLQKLLTLLGAAYLDTGESRGLVPPDHASVVAAMRGGVMGQADVVVTLGRKLDFQLAFGSPAIFGQAKFIRLADNAAELRDNRRGEVELLADVAQSLQALCEAGAGRQAASDTAWLGGLRQQHLARAAKLQVSMQQAPPGGDHHGAVWTGPAGGHAKRCAHAYATQGARIQIGFRLQTHTRKTQEIAAVGHQNRVSGQLFLQFGQQAVGVHQAVATGWSLLHADLQFGRARQVLLAQTS